MRFAAWTTISQRGRLLVFLLLFFVNTIECVRISSLFPKSGSVSNFLSWFNCNRDMHLEKAHSVSKDSRNSTELMDNKQRLIELHWRHGFHNCEQEVAGRLVGKAPFDINGTYYRNGYGMIKIGDHEVHHPFDGDGMIVAISFHKGNMFFRNRFVQTEGFLRDMKERRFCFPGVFGTRVTGNNKKGLFSSFSSNVKNVKNVANTNIIYWANRLLALWEGGLPHVIHPDNLATMGTFSYDNRSTVWTAHPKIDTATNRLITFSMKRKLLSSTVNVIELDGKEKIVQQVSFHVGGFSLFHDFAFTKNYYIFMNAPLAWNLFPILFTNKGLMECISCIRTKPTIFYLVHRESGKVHRIPVDNQYSFHYCNAFEDENGDIIVDFVKNSFLMKGSENPLIPLWKADNLEKLFPTSSIVSVKLIRIENGWVASDNRILDPVYAEFPVVHPSFVGCQYRYIYALCGANEGKCAPFKGLMRIDKREPHSMKWFTDSDDEFLSEPTFIPKSPSSSEDDGQGPILRIPLPVYTSYGLHGNFFPNLLQSI